MTAAPGFRDLLAQARVHIHNHGLAEFARHTEASTHAIWTETPVPAARWVAIEAAHLLRLFRAMVGDWNDVSGDMPAEGVMEAIGKWLADEQCPIPADEAFASAPVEQAKLDSDFFRARLDGHVFWVRREEDADFDGESYHNTYSYAVVRREAESAVEPAEVRR